MTVAEKDIIAWLSERKLMPSPELVTHVSNHPEGLVLLEKSVDLLKGPKLFLSVSDLIVDENPEPPKPISRPKVAEIPPVIIDRQITKSLSDGKLESYVSLFNDRFKTLSRLVRRNPSMRDAGFLSNLHPDEENKVVGMIADIQTFPNGRIRVVLEDSDGRLNVMLKEEKESLNLLNDEVIGVSGKLNRQGNTLFVSCLARTRPVLSQSVNITNSRETGRVDSRPSTVDNTDLPSFNFIIGGLNPNSFKAI